MSASKIALAALAFFVFVLWFIPGIGDFIDFIYWGVGLGYLVHNFSHHLKDAGIWVIIGASFVLGLLPFVGGICVAFGTWLLKRRLDKLDSIAADIAKMPTKEAEERRKKLLRIS